MQNELTYIGPESQGPHYTESGKRPAGKYPTVVMMLPDGRVVAGTYDRDCDGFSREDISPAIEAVPVCWWHLPAAAPSTEREWWMAQFVQCLPFSESQGFRAKIGTKLYIAGDREEMAEMYAGWVEAGRP